MISRGLYYKNGELFGYLVGGVIYDLEDNQTGYLEEGYIFSMDGERRWAVRGDGIYTLKGESVGYIGSRVHDE